MNAAWPATVLTRHVSRQPSYSLSFSQPKQVVAAASDNTVRVWDTATGKQLHLLRAHTEQVGASMAGRSCWHALHARMQVRLCAWRHAPTHCMPPCPACLQAHVLDAHPWQPSLVLSAGYDGQVVVLDVVRGTVVRRWVQHM